MNDFYRAIAGRIVGALVGAFVGYLASKGVHDISPNAATELTTALTNGAMLAGYGVAHKLTNRSVNPTDSASGT